MVEKYADETLDEQYGLQGNEFEEQRRKELLEKEFTEPQGIKHSGVVNELRVRLPEGKEIPESALVRILRSIYKELGYRESEVNYSTIRLYANVNTRKYFAGELVTVKGYLQDKPNLFDNSVERHLGIVTNLKARLGFRKWATCEVRRILNNVLQSHGYYEPVTNETIKCYVVGDIYQPESKHLYEMIKIEGYVYDEFVDKVDVDKVDVDKVDVDKVDVDKVDVDKVDVDKVDVDKVDVDKVDVDKVDVDKVDVDKVDVDKVDVDKVDVDKVDVDKVDVDKVDVDKVDVDKVDVDKGRDQALFDSLFSDEALDKLPEVPKERFKATNPEFNLTPEQLITLESRIQLNKDYATSEILQILSDIVGYKVSRLKRIDRYAEWTVSYVRAQSRVVIKSWK